MTDQITEQAAGMGLFVSTWSPGDGATRYRFTVRPQGYSEGDGLYTALGRAQALVWLNGFSHGQIQEDQRHYDAY